MGNWIWSYRKTNIVKIIREILEVFLKNHESVDLERNSNPLTISYQTMAQAHFPIFREAENADLQCWIDCICAM